MNRKVLVSIHDVWPGSRAEVQRDLDWLRKQGVKSVALMVVPFYHGRRSIDQEPEFQAWLKEKQNQGAEIFMHGYRHLMPEVLGEKAKKTWFGKWLNSRVQNEGEFAGLDAEQAGDLLRKGLEIFSKTGIEPAGFTLPTWWGKVPAGLTWPATCRFFDGRFYVWNRTIRKCLWAPVLTFDNNEKLKSRIYGGAVWMAYLLLASQVRIALHPGDLEIENNCKAVKDVLKERKIISYAEFSGK